MKSAIAQTFSIESAVVAAFEEKSFSKQQMENIIARVATTTIATHSESTSRKMTFVPEIEKHVFIEWSLESQVFHIKVLATSQSNGITLKEIEDAHTFVRQISD